MLFANRIGAISQPELHQLKLLVQHDISHVEVQIEDEHIETAHQWSDVFQLTNLTPVSIKLPNHLKVGDQSIDLETFKSIVSLVNEICPVGDRRLVLQSATTTLGEIFEYLDKHTREFTALSDFKQNWIQNMINEIKSFKEIADASNVKLLIENAPISDKEYFEPGRAMIYPALRTPADLIQIVKETGISCCFNSANAKITTNVLAYMKRSRSLFAAATEEEIEHSPKNWPSFYEQLAPHIDLIQLSDSISWGDTESTTHIPFREESYPDLLNFADNVKNDVPIILSTNILVNDNLKLMMKRLRQLKK